MNEYNGKTKKLISNVNISTSGSPPKSDQLLAWKDVNSFSHFGIAQQYLHKVINQY